MCPFTAHTGDVKTRAADNLPYKQRNPQARCGTGEAAVPASLAALAVQRRDTHAANAAPSTTATRESRAARTNGVLLRYAARDVARIVSATYCDLSVATPASHTL